MYDDLAPYHYQFIDTEVTIRSVNASDHDEEGGQGGSGYWYKGNENDKSYTVYATINGQGGASILTNLRIDNFYIHLLNQQHLVQVSLQI